MKIALDLFGGDHAPQATVDGAILALNEAVKSEYQGLEVILVGNRKALNTQVRIDLPEGIKIHDVAVKSEPKSKDPHADGDDPKSPIRTALRLHRAGRN